MGISPGEMDAMSLWQYRAALAGWNRAHGGDDGHDEPSPMSPERYEELLGGLDDATLH